MNDRTIVRMLEGTCKVLSEMDPYQHCEHLVPSYNALLNNARVNHPEDPFLSVLPDLKLEERAQSGTIQVLFTQLRIAVESLQEDMDESGRQPGGHPAGGRASEAWPPPAAAGGR